MYVEASTNAIITNDMASRTHSCISLGPSGNWQGSTKCFDLSTRDVLTHRTVKEVPMPDRVKKVVNSLMGMDVDLRPFFVELHQRLTISVNIRTPTTHLSGYDMPAF